MVMAPFLAHAPLHAIALSSDNGPYVNFARLLQLPEPRVDHKLDIMPKRWCRIGRFHTRPAIISPIGWMDPTSKTKLRRMAKYFPAERVDVLEKEAYYALKRDLRNAFEWETQATGARESKF